MNAKVAPTADDISASKPAEKTPQGWREHWYKELEAAQKRTRRYLKAGNKIVRRYSAAVRNPNESYDTATDDRTGETLRLHLFNANVNMLQDMMFGQTPQVDVSREFDDPDDDVARVASLLFQRLLERDHAPNTCDQREILKQCLQDRLLPGQGVARVMYQVDTTEIDQIQPDGTSKKVPMVTGENCSTTYVHWQDFRWGWARSWKETPWIAFRVWLEKHEAAKRFGAKMAEKLEYKTQLPSGSDDREDTTETDQGNNVLKAEIWEVWNKLDRRVYWFHEGCEEILDQRDDPLQLRGFWPCPRPMAANLTTTLYQPVADYTFAADLYNEIDELSTRVSIITQACKVVGVYDETAGDSVGRMLKEGVENDLIPVPNWAMFAEKGGLQGSIDWFPVQEIVGVLQTLTETRDRNIELLYQITGMSDILRGHSQQYAGVGQEQLKAKFASIRVQALQDEFARFASDLDALKAECISRHYSPQTIARDANANYIPRPDHQYIGPALALMKEPRTRWRITIRPESLAMVDYAQLQTERGEFLTAMATFLQSSQAMVQAVPQSLPVLLEMMKWAMVGFKGADYLEGIMDQAIDMAQKMPPPGQDDGKQQEQAAAVQLEQMKHQNAMQQLQAKGQQQMQAELQKFRQDMQLENLEFMNKVKLDNASSSADIQKIAADLQADLRVIAEKLGADLAVQRQEHAHALSEGQAQHSDKMAETRAQAASRASEGPSDGSTS